MTTCWPSSFEVGEEIEHHPMSAHITLSEHGRRTQDLNTVWTLSFAAGVRGAAAAAQLLTDLSLQRELPASLKCELSPSETLGHCLGLQSLNSSARKFPNHSYTSDSKQFDYQPVTTRVNYQAIIAIGIFFLVLMDTALIGRAPHTSSHIKCTQNGC